MLHSAARRDALDLELARRFHDDHDLQARDELVERLMPLIRTLAARFVGRGETYEDLLQVGALGLVKAIGRFVPTPGSRFVSYAAPTITGEMQRHFRDHCWDVHVPRAAQELAGRVGPARAELAARTGHEPRTAAIAVHLGVSEDAVRDATRASDAYAAQSLEAPVGDGAFAVLEHHGSTDPGYGRVDDRDLVARATAGLDPRAASIVRERFVGERLQREIAADHGVGQMQVSRILSSSLAQMRERLGTAA